MGIIFNYFKNICNKIQNIFLSSKLYLFISLFNKRVSESVIINYLFSDGGFAYKWRSSFICNKILCIINYFINVFSLKKINVIGNSYLKSYGSSFVYIVFCIFVFLTFILPQTVWSNYYIFLGTFLLILLYCIFYNKGIINLKGVDSYIILYIILVIFSSLWSSNILISFRYLSYFICSVLSFVMIINIVINKDRLFNLIYIISFGLFICSICGIFQYFNITPDSLVIDINNSSFLSGRVYSFFGNPNMFASIIILFLPLQISMCLSEKTNKKKIFFGIVFLVALIALVLTFSRGAWIAFIISICLFIFMIKPKYGFIFLMFCILLIPFLPEVVILRFLSIFSSDSSISLRMTIYLAAINFIGLSPIYGSGMGALNLQTMVYNHNLFPLNRPPFVHAHNLFFQIASESGICTLLFFVLFNVLTIIRIYKICCLGKVPKYIKYICYGFISCFIGILIFSIFDYTWYFPRVLIINWFFIGMLYVIINLYGVKERVDLDEEK